MCKMNDRVVVLGRWLMMLGVLLALTSSGVINVAEEAQASNNAYIPGTFDCTAPNALCPTTPCKGAIVNGVTLWRCQNVPANAEAVVQDNSYQHVQKAQNGQQTTKNNGPDKNPCWIKYQCQCDTSMIGVPCGKSDVVSSMHYPDDIVPSGPQVKGNEG